MARHSYISNLEDLKKWFEGLGKSCWNLYRGHQERVSHGKMIYKQADDTIGKSESWELLRDMIEMNSGSGGQFTVYVPNTANGNQGTSVLVGINMSMVQSGIRTSVSGINGAPAVGFISTSQHQDALEKEKRLWHLERQVEDMSAAQDAGLGITDILKDQLRGIDLNPLIAGVIAHFSTKGVQLHGTPEDVVQDQNEQAGDYTYDGQRLTLILNTIRPHFEDDNDFYDFLEKVSISFNENPDMFKKMV